MMKETVRDAVTQGVSSGFAALATAFVQESLSHMIPWLIVTCAVIVCDLCFGIRKSLIMGEDIRGRDGLRHRQMVVPLGLLHRVLLHPEQHLEAEGVQPEREGAHLRLARQGVAYG